MTLKVLICDDAGFVREILTQAVLELGHQVVAEARDGVEVVQLAKKFSPDVIFMDLILPHKNGTEATKDIKAENPRIQVIAISTNDEGFLKRKAKEAGCEGFLVKPFSKAEIKMILDRVSRQNREVKNG